MDINSIISQLTSSDALQGIAGAAKTDAKDAKSVIENAVGPLFKGAVENCDVSKLGEVLGKYSGGFGDVLKKIDLKDGKKLLGQLLGKSEDDTVREISRASGVDEKSTTSILSAAAPLVANILSGETNGGADLSGLLSGILKSLDLSKLLGGLAGGLFGGK